MQHNPLLTDKQATAIDPAMTAPAESCQVQVLGCSFVEEVQPAMPVLLLRWQEDHRSPARMSWRLPGGIRWTGPWPRRFGVTILRSGPDSYQVRLIWDELYWLWSELPATELRRSAIAQVLAALGTEMQVVLAQPISRHVQPPERNPSPRHLAA
jgi:hypothetical protein